MIAVKKFKNLQNTKIKVVAENSINYIPKISIIIPIYNTELYLKEYVEEHKRIKIVYKENGGLSSAEIGV